MGPKGVDEVGFHHLGVFVARYLPPDLKSLESLYVPQESATAVSNRLAEAEVDQLTHALSNSSPTTSFTDVENRGLVYPVFVDSLERIRRVFTLEPAGW